MRRVATSLDDFRGFGYFNVDVPLPWQRPENEKATITPFGVFGLSTDGPSAPIDFDLFGVRFRVKPTDHYGSDSGRRRMYIACLTCQIVIHPGTTGASEHVRSHLHDHAEGPEALTRVAGYSAALVPDEPQAK